MKDKLKLKPILIASGVIVGMVLVLFLSTSVVPKALVSLTQASSSGKVVVSNSYMIGQRILAKADGKDKCIINVFLLDKNGRGVAGKTAELTGLTSGIKAINTMSDAMGKISFELTSVSEGQFKINATSGGLALPQTIVVTFRN